MKRILIDTSAYSAFFRGHPNVIHAIQQADKLYLTTVVIGELLAGFRSGNKEDKNRIELSALMSSKRVEVFEINQETSERYSIIANFLKKSGLPIPTNDIWISASAMQHGLTVLTTDTDYLRIPQILTEYYHPKWEQKT